MHCAKRNDELQYDEAILKQLLDGDIDEPLAKHIAHMFIRDPHQVHFGCFYFSLLS